MQNTLTFLVLQKIFLNFFQFHLKLWTTSAHIFYCLENVKIWVELSHLTF